MESLILYIALLASFLTEVVSSAAAEILVGVLLTHIAITSKKDPKSKGIPFQKNLIPEFGQEFRK